MATEELAAAHAARASAASEYDTRAAVLAGLRAGGACDGAAVDAAKAELKAARQALDAAKKAVDAAAGGGGEGDFDRVQTETLLRRRFFISPAFEIYGGVAGLYDYGPPGKCLFRPSSSFLFSPPFAPGVLFPGPTHALCLLR